MNRLRCSVAIPTYQRADLVRRALEALAQQTLSPADFEVLISIDGSEDGTRELVESFAAPYRLRALWQPNRGAAAARNAALRQTAGKVVVFLDDDMAPAPGCLEAHVGAHERAPNVCVMGPVPVEVDASSPPHVRYVASRFSDHMVKLSSASYSIVMTDFYSGNFSIRRQALLQVGGFDEDFHGYANEDLELYVRLRDSAVRFAFEPDALSHQRYTKSFERLARDQVAKGQDAVLLVLKHPAILPDLRLGGYLRSSRRRRLARGGLLALSRLWSGTPDAAIRFVGLIERWKPSRASRLYGLLLNYLYWVGARNALYEPGDDSLAMLRSRIGV